MEVKEKSWIRLWFGWYSVLTAWPRAVAPRRRFLLILSRRAVRRSIAQPLVTDTLVHIRRTSPETMGTVGVVCVKYKIVHINHWEINKAENHSSDSQLTAVVDLTGGGDVLRPHIFSISCSFFLENMAKSYVKIICPFLQEIMDPPLDWCHLLYCLSK